ncbi:MAG: TadE family protein [Thermodesulfovibrionales bacterium]
MKQQKASAAVEVALIFPLLLACVLAIAEYGIYFVISYETEQVAYQAAKIGAMAHMERAAIAGAEANRLITELGLSGYDPEVKVSNNPPGHTEVRVTFRYTTVTGVSDLPVVSLLFPSKVDKKASYKNF